MGRGHGSMKNFCSYICPLFSVALCNFCKQQTSSLLCCMLWACSQAAIPSQCCLREDLEGNVVLKCIMPVPRYDKLKLYGQLPLYLLAFRQLNRCDTLLHVDLIYLQIQAEVWLQTFASFCHTFCCEVHNTQYSPFLLASNCYKTLGH